MKKLFDILAIIGLVVIFTGCTTYNPDTGQKEYDPIRTEQVKAAIEGVAVVAVRRVLDDTHEKSPNVLLYLQQSADFVCLMKTEKKFSPEFLIDGLNKGLADTFQNQGVDPLILDLKELLISIYKINYASRLNADLNEEGFLLNMLDVLCNSMNRGIADFIASQGFTDAQVEELQILSQFAAKNTFDAIVIERTRQARVE
jgi:hypothetical protein